jgi:hypothetical protein
MKHILDASFRYRPSFDTDVRRTFEKARKQQSARDLPKAKADVQVKVLKLEQLKKATAT